jgi:hypothetical protein
MYRLSSTAPLVISTLYNGLCPDSCSGHFTQSYTYYLMNSNFLATLYYSQPHLYFYLKQDLLAFHFLPKKPSGMLCSFFHVSTVSYVNRLQLEPPHSHYDALVLKETKYQLFIYGKMPIVNGFPKACYFAV